MHWKRQDQILRISVYPRVSGLREEENRIQIDGMQGSDMSTGRMGARMRATPSSSCRPHPPPAGSLADQDQHLVVHQVLFSTLRQTLRLVTRSVGVS